MNSSSGFWRRHPDLNRGIKVLQTSALPLGYVAVSTESFSTEWKTIPDSLAGVVGFEPTHDGIRIHCLTAWRYPCVRNIKLSFNKDGVDGEIRTHVYRSHNPGS